MQMFYLEFHSMKIGVRSKDTKSKIVRVGLKIRAKEIKVKIFS